MSTENTSDLSSISRSFMRAYVKQSSGYIALSTFSVLMEIFTLVLIMPILKTDQLGLILKYPFLDGVPFYSVIVNNPIKAFLLSGILFIFTKRVARFLLNDLNAKIVRDCREMFLDHSGEASLEVVNKVKASTAINILTQDIPRVANGITSICKLPAQVISQLLLLLMTLALSAKLLYFVVIYLLFIALFFLYLKGSLKLRIDDLVRSSKDFNKLISNFFYNLKFFKANNYTEKAFVGIKSAINLNSEMRKEIPDIQDRISFFYEFAGFVFLALFFYQVKAEGIEFVSAVVLIGVYFRICPIILSIQKEVSSWNIGLRSLEDFTAYCQIFKENKDLKKNNKETNLPISISDMTFRRESGFHLRVSDFHIKDSEKVFIYGDSGSGKSTLIDLILGALPTTANSIQIGGQCRSDYDFKAHIAYLTNTVPVVTGSIYQNLILGHLQSIDRVNEVVEMTGLKNVFDKHFLDLESIISAEDPKLSQGELQRLNLCRALLSNFQILILDEATNSIDIESEKEILERMFLEFQKKTIVFVSHRLNNLELFDTSYVMKDGLLC